MKLLDRAKELTATEAERKGWCKYCESRVSQRENRTFYDCNHKEAKRLLMCGADEPCLAIDMRECPFIMGVK